MQMQTSLFDNKPHKIPESHANRGLALETALSWQHAQYAQRGVARMDKAHVPSVLVKDGRWAKVIGRAIVDYTGLMCGGLHVAFDAKDCAGKRIELSRLQTHQLEYLEDVAKLGGCAFILARFERRDMYAIPVVAWRLAIEARRMGHPVESEGLGWEATGKASINVKELPDKWRVERADWAKTIAKAEGGWSA